MADKARPKCFIIMPITTPDAMREAYSGKADHFRHVLDYLLVPSVEDAGFEAIRPVATGADLIHAKIINQLETSELVLCDMSCLNANVFFELGIRTALNKPVCMVIDDVSASAPFDTTIINHHKYSGGLEVWRLKEERKTMVAHVKASAVETNNTLWKYFGLSGVAQAPATPGEDDRLDYLSRQVEALAKTVKSSWGQRTGMPVSAAARGEAAWEVLRALGHDVGASRGSRVGGGSPAFHALREVLVSKMGDLNVNADEFCRALGMPGGVVDRVLRGLSIELAEYELLVRKLEEWG